MRLSELEIRQLERSAELQARADRIKERENKRKASLKKKQERMDKERENRQRMGIASQVKETCGASQMRLGAFIDFGLGLKRKREETPTLSPASSSENSNCSGSQRSGPRAAPTRSPLQPRSSNPVIDPANKKPQPNINPATKVPSEQSKQTIGTTRAQHFLKPTSMPPSKPTMKTPPRTPASRPLNARTPAQATPVIQPPTRARVPAQVNISKPITPKPQPSIPSVHKTSMLPPPKRPICPPARPTAATTTASPIVPNHQRQPPKPSPTPPPPPSAKPMAPPPRLRPQRLESPTLRPPTRFSPHLPLPQPPDDPWSAFLVSNTQIERELSTDVHTPPSAAKPPAYQKPAKPSITPSFPTAAKPPRDNDTAALLAGLCTQDLDYDADLEPDSLPDLGTRPKQAARSFEDDTISDAELEDVVRDMEERSSLGMVGEGQQMAKTESFYDEFFDMSTQELCELVC